MQTAELAGTFDQILEALRDELGACRTTLRLDNAKHGFHVDRVCAEALVPGTRSLREETSLDQRNAVAVKWLEKNRRVFVEDDTLEAEPEVAPEREVIEVYGIRSEMVGPLIRDGELVGWLSVHYTKGPRDWKPEEVARLEGALSEVARLLDADA